jgi:hypothetical protein
MAKCPNGHEQRLGLKCRICGSDLSYRSSIEALRILPKVDPDYGKVSVLTVESPRLLVKAGYVGEIVSGQSDLKSATSFQAAAIRGGSWLDFQRKYLQDLRRWMALVGMDKSADKFLVIDTTKPISVVAISALPKLEHTALIAVVADEESTPMEQNTSYVALSLALKKGLPVIALSESFEREMLFFTEDRGFATGGDAMSRLLAPLLEAADDLMDLLERDLKLGIKMHCVSAIMAGSKSVFGAVTNALTAQSYNVSLGTNPEEYQTVHSLVFSTRETEAEFEKSFGAFRNRKFKGALSAELRFHETTSPLYDLLTICGLKGDSPLQTIAGGYEAIIKSVPELTVDGAS